MEMTDNKDDTSDPDQTFPKYFETTNDDEISIKQKEHDSTIGENNFNLQLCEIDCVPGLKEVDKKLSACMLQMFGLVHPMKAREFVNFCNQLKQRFPHDQEYKILCLIHEMDRHRLSKRYKDASRIYHVQLRPRLQAVMNAKSYELLSARAYTARAHLLFFMNEAGKAGIYHRRAANAIEHHRANTCSAYNDSTRALNCLLHKRDQSGGMLRPTSATWEEAGKLFLGASDQHKMCSDIYLEDSKAPEERVWELRLRSLIRYIFTLIQICPGKGFRNLVEHKPSETDIQRAMEIIGDIIEYEHCLTPRTKMEYHLCQCDCTIRRLQKADPSANLVEEAKIYAGKALDEVHKYNEKKQRKEALAYPQYRLEYIKRFEMR